MTNPPPSTQSQSASPPAASLHSLFKLPEAPQPASAEDELTTLRHQFAALRASQATAAQRAALLERLYARSMAVVGALTRALGSAALTIPIQKNIRQQIRTLQQLLRSLAEEIQAALDGQAPAAEQGRALWRSLHALAQHLLISSLVAAPAVVGVWRQLHQSYETARRLGLTDYSPDGAAPPMRDVYYAAVLLGCAQPAAFTSTEIAFIARYLVRYSDAVDPVDALLCDESARTPAAFWIDPARDATAFACTRKTAPPQTPVHYFCCTRIAARLAQQLSELEGGASAAQLQLPEMADSTAGRGVLRRLMAYWGEPCKRRYPRRRQNYRAILCSGLARLWRLFQEGGTASLGETSNWMITNESPDGYAFMHVSGKTGGLSVGDITAIRTESGKAWQICIVRWALSENQEHLELGLQILATRAQPARLALPSRDNETTLLSVLTLPAIGALHTNEMLVIPATALERLPDKLILVVEKENIEVREVKRHRLSEQNSKIAILAIEPDPRPG